MPHEHRIGHCTLTLQRSDITLEHAEAIANAANPGLRGGGGVDGAIHRAAGPRLQQACRVAVGRLNGGVLPTGGVALTDGFDLVAKYVIHCVGPVYDRDGPHAPRLLARCYSEALRVCREHGIRSIAFPSISTGAYGYPVEEAARVAVDQVVQVLREHGAPQSVRFCLFDDATLDAYVRAAKQLLG